MENVKSTTYVFWNWIFLLALVVYSVLFWLDLKDYWFSPNWTTDDAKQQLYPFHAIAHPEIFKDDLITEMVTGYLAPAHYWLGVILTWFSGDPVMMGHWVTLLQILLPLVFLGLFVYRAAGALPAFFSLLWFLHSRNLINRITGGLPRGWSAALLTAFLYFLFTKRHKSLLATILVGCLLNPPATIIVGAGYGLYLLFGSCHAKSRSLYLKPFMRFLLFCPVFCVITFYVVHRPPEIGQMVSFEEASLMPEFSRPHGRFPILPFISPWEEIKAYGFEVFAKRVIKPRTFERRALPFSVLGIFVGLVIISCIKKRALIPWEVMMLGAASLLVYVAARLLAFYLYIPDRHLQIPLGIFFIAAFCVGIGRLFDRTTRAAPRAVSFLLLGCLIFWWGGDGLKGKANFNTFSKKFGVMEWIRKNTPEDSLVAGHPTHIDGVQLFGVRKAFATKETAHPFYPVYYKEIKRRLEISLRAHYAIDEKEFLSLLGSEGIDYFVFNRSEFAEEALAAATYFRPLDSLVRELATRDPSQFVYKGFLAGIAAQGSAAVFSDSNSLVIDVNALRAKGVDDKKM